RRPGRRLHPVRELCRPRFLNCERLSSRCVMALTLKYRIAREANDLGFAAVRFASADPPPGAGAALEDFLASGRHGDMAWLADKKERRQPSPPTLHHA